MFCQYKFWDTWKKASVQLEMAKTLVYRFLSLKFVVAIDGTVLEDVGIGNGNGAAIGKVLGRP